MEKGVDLEETESKQSVTGIIADAFVTTSLLVAQKLNVPWIAVWVPLSCCLSAHFYTNLVCQEVGGGNGAKYRALDFLPGWSKMKVEDLLDNVVNVGGEHEREEKVGEKNRKGKSLE